MSLQKTGSNYDNDIANTIDGVTPDDVRAHSMRGSGNTKYANPDVLVRTHDIDHAIEAKRASWDAGDRDAIADPDDLMELAECGNPYTFVWFAVKFTRRELAFVGPLNAVVHDEDGTPVSPGYVSGDIVASRLAEQLPDAFDAAYTDSGYVRVTKPETDDDWPTATAGASDQTVLLDALGVDVNDDEI